MSSKEAMLEAMGPGIVETLDPGLKRAFDFADNTVPLELRNPEKLRMHEDKLKVSGDGAFYTLQGEGITMGEPAVFLRLHVCNLRCSWSIAKGMLVTMSDGTKKPIEQIKKDDLVLSYKNKRFTVSRILGTSHYKKSIVKISTEEGSVVYATSDHQFYTNHHKSGRSRCDAKDLVGKYLKKSQVSSIKKTQQTNAFFTGYLKGALVGDGSISDTGGRLKMYFQVCDYDFIEKLKEIMDVLGFNSNITLSKRKTVVGKDVYRLSTGKHELILPLMTGPQNEDEQKGFIAGFFDAEGYVRERQLVLSQQDWKTVERVINLLDVYGFDVKVREEKRAYHMIINGKENIDRFFKLFPTFIKRKQKSFYEVNRGLKAIKVISVKPAEDVEVYDISTSTGNFFVEDYLTANCNAWYTWNPKTPEFWTEGKDWTIEEAKVQVESAWGCNDSRIQKRLILTGGEPMLQQDQILKLTDKLDGWGIEVETNGTIMPRPELLERVQFNCSPKLENSQNSFKARVRPDVIKELARGNTMFKFVVMEPQDLDEIEKDYVEGCQIDPEKVILMPQGVTADEVRGNAQKLAEYAKAKGYRMLTRLQVDLWGARRGV